MDTGAGTGIADLTADACWALLRASQVGRLAVIADGLPEIFPVNFVVDHGTVVIRTAPGTKLAAVARGPQVAFEVDGYDAEAGEAWSVVLKGGVTLREGMQEMVDTVALPLFPWHAEPKPSYLRVVPHTVTGRRFAVVAPSHWHTPTAAAAGAPKHA
jgi:nitroimidazol reductase NimA-like FMN-containing flavoprotein (pyridoxamine 5'-phosphate oxidase superfamily)